MTIDDKLICPKCGGPLKHYDSVRRIVRTKNGRAGHTKVKRVYCSKCGVVRRLLPETLLPFKQYEAEIIFGVLEGFITPDTLGFEDYPCEMTMIRWLSQKSQLLLWRNP